MTSEEAARERDRVRREASERASAERNKSTQQRSQETKDRNIERAKQRESVTNILTSGAANIRLSEIATQGGPVGRRLEREIRQFQQTGRVSNWLAGETLKAESAQNAAQQSAFRQAVVDVISSPLTPIQVGPTNSYIPPLNKKPIIQEDGGGGGSAIQHPFKITISDGSIKINAGTINGIIANNWDSSFPVSESVRYVVLSVTTNGLVITSSTLSLDSSSPPSPIAEKWALSSSFKVLIGAVIGQSIKQVVFNNLSATGVKRLTTEKSNIELQQIPYDNWYAWVVT